MGASGLIYARDFILNEFSVLESELSESWLTSLAIRGQIDHDCILAVREFDVKARIELKSDGITTPDISIICSTSSDVSIRALAPEEITISVTILKEGIDTYLDIISHQTIADHSIFVTCTAIRFESKGVKGLLKPCYSKP